MRNTCGETPGGWTLVQVKSAIEGRKRVADNNGTGIVTHVRQSWERRQRVRITRGRVHLISKNMHQFDQEVPEFEKILCYFLIASGSLTGIRPFLNDLSWRSRIVYVRIHISKLLAVNSIRADLYNLNRFKFTSTTISFERRSGYWKPT